jgi:spore photoproduct lyase
LTKNPQALKHKGLLVFYFSPKHVKCEYCYLLTNLGKKPYVRVYVNKEEILSAAKPYIEKRKPENTVFEGAATSDPMPTEPYTGLLGRTINFLGRRNLDVSGL